MCACNSSVGGQRQAGIGSSLPNKPHQNGDIQIQWEILFQENEVASDRVGYSMY